MLTLKIKKGEDPVKKMKAWMKKNNIVGFEKLTDEDRKEIDRIAKSRGQKLVDKI